MRKLLLIALLVPSLSFAQRSEIGFSTGTFASLDEIVNSVGDFIGGVHASLCYLYSYRHLQAGAGLEFDYLWGSYVVPKLIANYRFGKRQSYFYSGVDAGSTVYKVINGDTYMRLTFASAHAGYSYGESKHLAFNAEVGVRRYEQYIKSRNGTDLFNREGIPARHSYNARFEIYFLVYGYLPAHMHKPLQNFIF